LKSSATPRPFLEVWRENILLFRHWLRHPLAIGAMLPSGRAVARAMARELPISDGIVLELGGGTGALTSGLLEAGCRPEALVVVEREAALAAALRRRFPRVQVVEADACEISRVLDELGITALSGVVSSLPIKWFDPAGQRAIIEACFARMPASGVFLQVTNALVSPLPMRPLGLEGVQVARLWNHFPPVQIWRYRQAARPGASALERLA
jgi:phosphatidylethanolamine/phosphatidyl-N-methylethanolamine N-methyltransferase